MYLVVRNGKTTYANTEKARYMQYYVSFFDPWTDQYIDSVNELGSYLRKDVEKVFDEAEALAEVGLKDLEGKISADETASIQTAVDKLKEVNKGTDLAAIKAATEEVQQAFYKVSEKLYQQANPQGGAQGGYQQPGDDGVVDADYETVD